MVVIIMTISQRLDRTISFTSRICGLGRCVLEGFIKKITPSPKCIKDSAECQAALDAHDHVFFSTRVPKSAGMVMELNHDTDALFDDGTTDIRNLSQQVDAQMVVGLCGFVIDSSVCQGGCGAFDNALERTRGDKEREADMVDAR